MYGKFTYIWLIFMINVGKYTIQGSYGKELIVEVMQGMKSYTVVSGIPKKRIPINY